MYIQEPWFSLIREGRKDVEGRAAAPGRWGQFVGQVLEIRRQAGEAEMVAARVVVVRHYDTLDAYLDAEWQRAAPQCASKEEARATYLAIRMAGGALVFSDERVRARDGIEAVELQVL